MPTISIVAKNGTLASTGSGNTAIPVQQPYSVTLAEKANSRVADPTNRNTRTTLTATIQEAITPPSGQALGTVLHLQISTDNVNWSDLGTCPSGRTDKDSTNTYFVTSIDVPDQWVYIGTQNYWVRTWAAVANSDPGPSAAVESAALALTGLQLPSATDISSLTIASSYSSNEPAGFAYNAVRSDGTQYYSIPSISCDDSGAVNDPYGNFVRITCEDLDADKNPIGPEHAFAGAFVAGEAQTWGPLMGEYGTDGGSYKRSDNIAYVRFRVYVINAANDTTLSFQDSSAAQLQTGVGNGAGYVDILVAQGGGLPEGQVDPTRIKPGITSDQITGVDAAKLTNVASVSISSFSGNLDVSRVNNLGTISISTFNGNLDVSRVSNLGTLSISSFSGSLDVSRISNLGTVSISSFSGNLDISRVNNVNTINVNALSGTFDASKLTNLGAINIGSLSGTFNAANLTNLSSLSIQSFSGVILSSQVATGFFNDLTKFSSSLRPIATVSSLPPLPDPNNYPVGATIYNSADGKLYRNVNNSWSSSVAASDVSGQLTAANIEAIRITTMNGLIGAGQIGSVYASTINGQISIGNLSNIYVSQLQGTLSSTQCSSININSFSGSISSINATTVTLTGQWSNGQIGSIDAGKLIAGTVAASITITTPSISGGTITGTSLSITTATGTVTINSTSNGVAVSCGSGTSNGVYITSGSYSNAIQPGAITISNGTVWSSLATSQLQITYGSQYSILTGYSLTVNNYTIYDSNGVHYSNGTAVIDSSRRFVGAGVYCPSNNVNCYSLTVGAGGISGSVSFTTSVYDQYWGFLSSSISTQNLNGLTGGRYLLNVLLGAWASGSGTVQFTFWWNSGGHLRSISTGNFGLSANTQYGIQYYLNIDNGTGFSYSTNYTASGNYECAVTLTRL